MGRGKRRADTVYGHASAPAPDPVTLINKVAPPLVTVTVPEVKGPVPEVREMERNGPATLVVMFETLGTAV